MRPPFLPSFMGVFLAVVLGAAPAQAQLSERYEFIKGIKDGDVNATINRLNNGQYPDARDGEGTPALIVAQENGGMPWVALLLKHGADVNVQNRSDGKTVLMIFAEKGDADAVATLLRVGAKPNVTDRFGETALIKASRARQFRAAKALVDGGADIEIQDSTGSSALEYAQTARARNIEQLLQNSGHGQ